MFYSNFCRLQLLAFLCLVLSVLCTCGGSGNNATTLAVGASARSTNINVTSGCTGASPTWTAANPSHTEISACIALASSGDTIIVPAGSATWVSGISLASNKLLTLKGAGATSTVISHGAITAISMVGAHRVTGMGFKLTNSGGVHINVRGQGWRIDHCEFNNLVGTSQYSIQATGQNMEVPPTGLIDNNKFVEGRIDVNGMMSFLKISTLWASDPVIGTKDQVYIEDNTFHKAVVSYGNVIDSSRGASFVARYNTVSGTTQFQAHGLQDDRERGTKSWEVYGNKFTSIGESTFSSIFMRSGTGIIAYNQSDNYQYSVGFDDRRAINSGSFPTIGACDGNSYADGNTTGQSGWPCRDQIGRGKDASLWTANTVNPAPAQASSPAYLFANRQGTSAGTVISHNNTGNWIKADRDYYTHSESFNGTSGVGCGTLANRPASCTPGVAYWATNQSCTNLTGMVGANPATSVTGKLYKCDEHGQWEVNPYYTPYTYPHPLRE